MLRVTAACLGIVLFNLISCSRIIGDPVEPPPPPHPPGPTLSIFAYAEQPKFPLVGASVVLVTEKGSDVLGLTNERGLFVVDKAKLRGPENLVLLVCFNQSPTDCTAIRLDVGRPLDVDELNVNVPNPKVIDRAVVGRKDR